MNENQRRDEFDDEIDLLEILGIFWAYKFLIIGLTSLCLIAATAFIFLRSDDGLSLIEDPNFHYKAVASLYFPLNPQTEQSFAPVAREIILSNAVYEILDTELSILKAPIFLGPREKELNDIEKKELYSNLLDVNLEKNSGLLTLNFFHPDEQMARNAVDRIIESLRTRLDSLGASQSYTLLESASIKGGEVIKHHTDESRNALYIILAFILGLMGSFFLAIILNFIRKVKSDPEALKKLRGEAL